MATPRRPRAQLGTVKHAENTDLMQEADGTPTEAGDIARLVVVQAILEGCTVTQAADRAGVARSTASVWLHMEDDTRSMLAAGRQQLAEEHQAKLSRLHGRVLDKLNDALDDPGIKVGDVVAIARALGPAMTASDAEGMDAPRTLKFEIEARAFDYSLGGILSGRTP